MFADPIAITYNAVSKSLARINQDSNGSDYYFDGGTEKFTLSIRHTIPKKGLGGETHFIRLDVDHHDANGLFLRRVSAWQSMKSLDLPQDTTKAGYASNALVGLLTTTNVGKLLAREV